jgi:hypothetical protein
MTDYLVVIAYFSQSGSNPAALIRHKGKASKTCLATTPFVTPADRGADSFILMFF